MCAASRTSNLETSECLSSFGYRCKQCWRLEHEKRNIESDIDSVCARVTFKEVILHEVQGECIKFNETMGNKFLNLAKISFNDKQQRKLTAM